jgi:Na+/melibiose symporter and related transporters
MSIAFWGFIWTLIFSVVAQIGSQPIVNALGNGNKSIGFRNFMFAAMILFGLIYMIIIKVSKERFTLQVEKQESLNIKTIFSSIMGSKYILIELAYLFAINLTISVRASIGIYYYKYYFNDENMLVAIGAIALVPTLIGSIICPVIAKKFGLRSNVVTAIIVNVVASVAMFFVPATASGKSIFIVLNVIAALFIGMAQPAQGTMIPTAIDFGEWKYNTNNGAFYGSVGGFLQTLPTAISGGIVAFVLAASHYVPDVEQSASALNGIKIAMSILPALFFLIGLVMLKWDLTEAQAS